MKPHVLVKKVIKFDHVSFSYPDKPILSDFNLLIQNKDRIGIVGENGKGKSTLLNLIAGELQADSGKVDIGENYPNRLFLANYQRIR